ncbi:MAG: adenosine kinase [Gammaproteobacteria bacterium]
MKTYDVYGIGAALVDIEFKVDDSFLLQNQVDKGLMTLVDEDRQYQLIANLGSHSQLVKRSCGGSACNTIVAASGFGAKAFYAGKVASDEEGVFFVKDLNTAGVDFHEVENTSGITGKCLVMITDDAERTMNTYLGVNVDLTSKEIDTQALANAQWLYIEGYLVTDSQRTQVAVEAMSFAKQHGVKTSLSLSDPFVVQVFSEQLKNVIGDGMDLLFCNEDEAISFTGRATVEQAAEALKDCAKSFVITRGAEGSLTYDGNQTTLVPGVKTRTINSNGAGDMFAGAFLYAISVGHDYVLAAQFANAAAARVVSQFGPRIEIAEYDELKQQFNI